MDICSIKEVPVKIMHKYIKTGITLGSHPIFGPLTKSIKNQNFILTPTNNKEKRFAQDFKVWLEERQPNAFIMPPKKHDKLMSVVLGLPHILGLVACDTLLDYGNFLEAKMVAGPSYELLLTLAEAVASEETTFYTSLQLNLPEVDKIGGLFLKKLKDWLNLIKKKDKKGFANKMGPIKSRLTEVDPNCEKSYKVMHKLLDAIKS